jgi:hypothetical protein
MPSDIGSTTIEFFRFGGEADSLQKGKNYIRTCGYQKPAEEVPVRIEPKELRRSLNRLRYRPDRTIESEKGAQELLGGEAEWFLPASLILPADGAALHQVDIVTHASELRAYPFEAIYANASSALESPDKGLILTRRIRSEFSYTVPPWPEVPSVLFVHAQVDHDLSQDLIDQHRLALCEALAPWGNPQDFEERKLLFVREIDSVEALEHARKLANFSYIHILAHGARVSEEDMEEHESEWGLRLGRADTDASSPKAVADALKPDKDHPLVVTLAACDSATSGPELGNSSLVETLHRNGIPVVVASQFPLTKPGSVTLTRAFYQRLLSGSDVRIALHAARVALREEARQVDERRHDWLSLVGYVRLPAEGYSQYLRAFGLRVELHMLEAARKGTESLFAARPPSRDAFDQVERRLRDRIMQLQNRKKELLGLQDRALQAECAGLLASGTKSLAELYFDQARHFPEEKNRFDSDGKTALEESLKWYSETYRRDLSRHWQGVQKLALEGALTGRISDPLELMIVRRVAQMACDEDPNEYWACGTLAETILLGVLTPEGFDLTSARAALNLLRERSARNAKDNGFAVKSTRRQFERYVTWWTKGNGYFPGRESDISAHAQALVGCLPVSG